MRKEKYGKLPVNARISINYTKKKPSVKFGYPRKDPCTQNRGMFAHLIMLILGIGLTLVVFYGIPFTERLDSEPKNCSFTPSINSSNNLITNITFICDNGINKTLDFKGTIGEYKSPYLKQFGNIFHLKYETYNRDSNAKQTLIIAFLIFLVLTVLPFLIEIPLLRIAVKNKWFQKKIPDINKALSGGGYKVTFKKVPDSLYLEIPLFTNIHLDYYATKDFSKYLQKMEIKEHPFWRITKRKRILRKKYVKKKNIYLWYARFYFSQKPESGKLEVMFK